MRMRAFPFTACNFGNVVQRVQQVHCGGGYSDGLRGGFGVTSPVVGVLLRGSNINTGFHLLVGWCGVDWDEM